jgi:hypothetical protein
MSVPSRVVTGRVRPMQLDHSSGRYEIRHRFPLIGEVIIVNNVDVSTDSPETGITLTSNPSRTVSRRSLGPRVEGERSDKKPHLFIVNKIYPTTSRAGFEWSLEGFVIRGYGFSDDPVQYVKHRKEYNSLIPLPPPSSSPPAQTPALFGPPLDVSIIPKQYSWVKAEFRHIDMGSIGWVRSDPRSNVTEHCWLTCLVSQLWP